MKAGIISAAIKAVKAAAYTIATGIALFVCFATWLLIDAITHRDDFPAKPQCLPAPQSICASTGDVGVRL